MKKHINLILAATFALAVFTLQACNSSCVEESGNVTVDERKVSEFNELEISGGFEVTLEQDSSNTVAINADDNILKLIKTDISGNKLKISRDDRKICNTNAIAIKIGVRNLKSITAAGAVQLASNGRLNLGDIELDFSGATKVDLDIAAANVKTEGSGVTEMTLKGQATSHTVDFSGSANLHAFDLVVSNYTIESAGQANCELNVLSEMDINTTGAADIKYKGNPAKIRKSKTGAFSLNKVQ